MDAALAARRGLRRAFGSRDHSPKKLPVNLPPSQPAAPASHLSPGFTVGGASFTPPAGLRTSSAAGCASAAFSAAAFCFFVFALRRAAARGGFAFRRAVAVASPLPPPTVDHSRCGRRLGDFLVARAADQDADAERQQQRRRRRRSGRRWARCPVRFFFGGGGGACWGLLHGVHQDDGVHEGKPGVAAPLAALEAVALVGRQRRPAGGALVAALHRRGAWIGAVISGSWGADGTVDCGGANSGCGTRRKRDVGQAQIDCRDPLR